MKNKLIIFFSLIAISFLIPSISHAMFYVPIANLTVVVNIQGQDADVNFDVKSLDGSTWHDYYPFDIQTQDLAGRQNIYLDEFSVTKYMLNQQTISSLILNISCVSDNANDVFEYRSNGVTFTPTINENIICTFNNVKDKIPVLIVPGIAGTELNKGDELLWADINRLMYTPGDAFLDPLAFNSNLTPIDSFISAPDVIKTETIPGYVFDYTDSLINEFKGQGYVEGQSLFTFPYDWRYGVTGKNSDGKKNSDLLKDKIQEIINQTGADKVDVVAHSMGGLIVKKYVADNPTLHHIGKAVFVAVPETGSVNAVKDLIQGDNFGISFGPVGLNDAELKKLAQNMPAIYDLLPSQKYYDTAGSFVSKIDIGYGIGEPTEEDLDYQNFGSYLASKNTNLQGFANAQNLHTQSFDDYDLRQQGIDLYAIDGCKTATMANFLEVKYKDILGNYHTDYDNIKLKTGDGTVAIESSTNLPIDQNKKYYALSLGHSKLLSADGSRQEIVNLISGSNLATGLSITQDLNQCQLNGKAIEVFSPVDVSVVDQNGNKLSLVDGNTTNQIPGANFLMMDSSSQVLPDDKILEDKHKFIYLPDGNNYSINLQGTGSGTFTLKVKEIQDSQIVKTENFINIPVTPALTGTVNLSDSQSSLVIQPTQDSSSQTILPTSVKDYDDFMSSIDTTPPEAVIQFDPTKKDLVFLANEDAQVLDKDNVITLIDKSGNSTEINLKSKNRKILMQTGIQAIKYNGVAADISKNKMAFLWLYDKKGNLKMLSQHAQSKNGYNILAIYDGKKTTLIGKDASGLIVKSFTGLKLMKITTQKGDLSWSY